MLPEHLQLCSSSEPKDTINDDEGDKNMTGMEERPQPTDKPRRKKPQPEQWQRNVRKKRRLEGKEYVSTTGTIVEAAVMKAPCNDKCRFKCYVIPEEDRSMIFRAYYELADYALQRAFIYENTDKLIKKRTTKTTKNPESRRTNSVLYFLPINGEKRKVCKLMFLNTLGIKKGVVDVAMQKRSNENVSDERGKGKSAAIDPLIKVGIMQHIKSYPCVPSHYCQAGTERKYLDSSLNLTIMYRMYSQNCREKNEPCAKLSMYRSIFKDNFNLGFHRPIEDQCKLCFAFDRNVNPTEIEVKEHDAHLKKKNEARND